jgi:hypothetical protein
MKLLSLFAKCNKLFILEQDEDHLALNYRQYDSKPENIPTSLIKFILPDRLEHLDIVQNAAGVIWFEECENANKIRAYQMGEFIIFVYKDIHLVHVQELDAEPLSKDDPRNVDDDIAKLFELETLERQQRERTPLFDSTNLCDELETLFAESKKLEEMIDAEDFIDAELSETGGDIVDVVDTEISQDNIDTDQIGQDNIDTEISQDIIDIIDTDQIGQDNIDTEISQDIIDIIDTENTVMVDTEISQDIIDVENTVDIVG